MTNIIYVLLGILVGAAALYLYFMAEGNKRLRQVEEANEKKIAQSQKRLAEIEQKAAVAETKLKEKILDGKKRALEIVEEAKKEEQNMRRQLEKQEERLISKDDLLEKKATELEKVKHSFETRGEQLRIQEEKVEALYKEQEEKLASITKLTTEEARQMLLNNLEREYKDELVAHYNKIKEEIKEDANKEAKNVLAQPCSRGARVHAHRSAGCRGNHRVADCHLAAGAQDRTGTSKNRLL